ncbi:radical SAM/SPASM domain-containing protein [Chloroflexota bacterium]
MIKGSPYSDWPWLLYLYLIRAYFRFLTAGKCLNVPLVLQLQTQSFRNGRCTICPYPISSQVLSNGTMERELFERIASELASEKQASMLVFGLHNEPLLDRRLFDWVEHIKARSPETFCIVVTNGELLDRFGLVEMLQPGLDQLIISINAYTREVYQSINAGLNFDIVIKNIQYLVSDRDMKPKVQLRFALSAKNAHEVKTAVDYWKTQGVRTKVRGITNRAGSLENFEGLRVGDNEYAGKVPWTVWHRLMSTARGFTGCDLPFYQMNILFNGDIIVCPHDWNRTTVVGNVKTSSLREIWNSERMNEIRQLILRKRYEMINSCRECSLAK